MVGGVAMAMAITMAMAMVMAMAMAMVMAWRGDVRVAVTASGHVTRGAGPGFQRESPSASDSSPLAGHHWTTFIFPGLGMQPVGRICPSTSIWPALLYERRETMPTCQRPRLGRRASHYSRPAPVLGARGGGGRELVLVLSCHRWPWNPFESN